MEYFDVSDQDDNEDDDNNNNNNDNNRDEDDLLEWEETLWNSSSFSSSTSTSATTTKNGRFDVVLEARPLYTRPKVSYSSSSSSTSSIPTAPTPVEAVCVTIPLPQGTKDVSLRTNVGTVRFDDVAKVCEWFVGKVTPPPPPSSSSSSLSSRAVTSSGVVVPALHGTFSLEQSKGERKGERRNEPTVEPLLVAQLSFVVPAASVSGLRIDQLTLLNETYQYYKGMRCALRAGSYQVRSAVAH